MGEKIKQKKWDREEVIVLVAEYFRTKQFQTKKIEENYHKISSILRNRECEITGLPLSDIFRDYSGIRMQSGRIRCLDPDTEYKSMKGTKLQIEIVDEFLANPDKIYQEANIIIAKYQ